MNQLRLFTAGLVMGLLLCLCGCDVSQHSGQPKYKVANGRYEDPKGYFQLVPPAGWRIQEYPDDVRGKVAFLAPEAGAEFRVLVNAVDFTSIDGLLDFCRSTAQDTGVPMEIEVFDFYGHQAVRRTFEIRGWRFLCVDFLIDRMDHNLQFSAQSNKYEQCLSIVLNSMQSYESIPKESDEKDILEHVIAKKVRLGRLMLENGRADLAIDYIREGLALDPQNQELLKLEQEVASHPQKSPESEAAVGKRRFESGEFAFSFDVPEHINVYTADEPGPMATRIRADTPIWIVNSMVPTERINVKASEGVTMRDLWQMLDITSWSGLSQYERILVREIKIGRTQEKLAYEHVHLLRQNPDKKLRQISFVHNGNAFVFTCSTSVDRYGAANKDFFDVIFESLEFK